MHQLIYHRTHITLRDHRHTATVTNSSRQNEQGSAQEIIRICLESIPMYCIKVRHTEQKTLILIFGSAHGHLNGIFFLISAHGVLRRMGAVTEIPGSLIQV